MHRKSSLECVSVVCRASKDLSHMVMHPREGRREQRVNVADIEDHLSLYTHTCSSSYMCAQVLMFET